MVALHRAVVKQIQAVRTEEQGQVKVVLLTPAQTVEMEQMVGPEVMVV
jgi:hypothetical protein